eukprot:TRINITY_DN670_c0_g1_i11.p1 TRINITY_DN670_c0_g1~~TRINITY_DN670_c0_g1_i11.p1  ORF type:complete len:253 (+),score=-20.59 TRINITY_DN670_c0_g1_i11:236-994(+)
MNFFLVRKIVMFFPKKVHFQLQLENTRFVNFGKILLNDQNQSCPFKLRVYNQMEFFQLLTLILERKHLLLYYMVHLMDVCVCIVYRYVFQMQIIILIVFRINQRKQEIFNYIRLQTFVNKKYSIILVRKHLLLYNMVHLTFNGYMMCLYSVQVCFSDADNYSSFHCFQNKPKKIRNIQYIKKSLGKIQVLKIFAVFNQLITLYYFQNFLILQFLNYYQYLVVFCVLKVFLHERSLSNQIASNYVSDHFYVFL